MKESLPIVTNRYYMRKILLSDATDNYLNWLSDKCSSKFIVSAKSDYTIEDLRNYISVRLNNDKVLFLGIFTNSDNKHIGNIKYEPIDYKSKTAEMGILIGNKDYRGIGTASEVIIASGNYLFNHFGIEFLTLGVDSKNLKAIKSYRKIGFEVINQTEKEKKLSGILRMKLVRSKINIGEHIDE